jgi:hypothetical protein
MTGGDIMKSIEIGLCDHSYTLRVPEKLKRATDKLTAAEKKDLKDEILIAMARICHRATFNPSVFLAD